MSTYPFVKRNQGRNRVGEPLISDLPDIDYIPPTTDDRLLLRQLEHRVRLLITAVRALADAADATGEAELARRARLICDHCER